MATTRVFSIEEAFRWGWGAMRRYVPVSLGLSVAWGVVWLLQNAIAAPSPQGTAGLRPVFSLVLQLAGIFLGFVWTHVALRIADGEPRPLDRLREILPQFFSYLLGSVLYALIVVGGLILLIVPGVIWAIQFGFFGFAVVEHKLDPIAALRASSRMTRGVKGRLFWFGLALVGINLLGMIALGVGILATVPLSVLATTYVYRRLAARPVPVEPMLSHLQPSGA